MDKRKNSEPTRLERLYDFIRNELHKNAFAFGAISTIAMIFIPFFIWGDTRQPLERANDAIQAYELCIEDNVHEMCLLEAIEAYN